MTTKLGKQVHLGELPQMKLIKRKLISTTEVPMVTKLGRMVTYIDGLLPIKPHDPLITWSCKIMWQTKNIISLLPRC